MRAWTLQDVREANAMTADQWAQFHTPGQDGNMPLNHVPADSIARHPWTSIIYVQRLCWQYDEAGALERLNGQMARAAA